MGYRVLENIEERMLIAVLQIGAAEGPQKVTARKVAFMCGVSDFTVFNRFGKNKQGILNAAARFYDGRCLDRIDRMFGRNVDGRGFWSGMLNFFLEDPNGALYYDSYVKLFGYCPKTEEETERLRRCAEKLFPVSVTGGSDESMLLLDHLVVSALNYAESVIHGYLTDTPEHRALAERLVFSGVGSVKG